MTSVARVDAQVPLLQLRGIEKSYPGTRALAGVDLRIDRGEVHALVGENGAGKSTLIRVLDGLVRPDAGEILIDGETVRLGNVRASRLAGISVVPQEVMSVPGLSVGQNVVLGQEPYFVNRRRLSRQAAAQAASALTLAGSGAEVGRPARGLSPTELRLGQIAHTLASPGRLVVFDEPTAVLSEHDAEQLLARLSDLCGEGRGILYVSHRLGEVMRVADRVTVLRGGEVVGTFATADVTREHLVELMARVDRPPRPRRSARGATSAGPANGTGLTVRGLSAESFADVDLDAHRGEIVGVAGVEGSGHGALVRTLAGLVSPVAGEVLLDGEQLRLGSVPSLYRTGVVYLPADRKRAGILAMRSVQENVVLGAGTSTQRFGIRRRLAERAIAQKMVEALKVQPPRVDSLVGRLSGGNQQKVALARALHADPEVLLLEEPTQGVDVEAKAEIHVLVREVADSGKVVILASSEFDELLENADRIAVMCAGRLRAPVAAAETSYGQLLHQAIP